MLEVYLREVVTRIAKDHMDAVSKSITSDETYEEIQKFAKKHAIKFL
jgi:hypothetical protein